MGPLGIMGFDALYSITVPDDEFSALELYLTIGWKEYLCPNVFISGNVPEHILMLLNISWLIILKNSPVGLGFPVLKAWFIHFKVLVDEGNGVLI